MQPCSTRGADVVSFQGKVGAVRDAVLEGARSKVCAHGAGSQSHVRCARWHAQGFRRVEGRYVYRKGICCAVDGRGVFGEQCFVEGSMAIEVESFEQLHVLAHGGALAFGMSRVSVDHFGQRAGESACDAAVGYGHQGLEPRAEKFACACGDGKLRGMVSCARELRVVFYPCAGNAGSLPREVSLAGFVETQITDVPGKKCDALLLYHDR